MAEDILFPLIPEPIWSALASLQVQLDQENLNPRICNILNQSVLTGGKRLRPMLTLLMGDLFGLAPEVMAASARDIERIHAATLAHDDVVDEASERRGRPSINSSSSNKKAILAGDYLLAQVLKDVAEKGDPRIVFELAQVIADLVEGEWLQIENARKFTLAELDLTFADVERVALKKTGSVLRWCCVAAGLLSGGDEETIGLCRRFGEALGIAFQWGDDILDFTREDQARGADLKTGVISSVVFMKETDPRSEGRLDLAVELVRKEMNRHLIVARDALTKLCHEGRPSYSGRDTKEALHCLIQYLGERV